MLEHLGFPLNRVAVFQPERRPALFCFSHLQWDFVFQRPQHLLTQAASDYRVFYIQEPEFSAGRSHFKAQFEPLGICVLTPVIDRSLDAVAEQRKLTQDLQSAIGSSEVIHWYYTPMAFAFAGDIPCNLCIYDCMDELSSFRFAPAVLRDLEHALLAKADIVFAGGASLFAAKQTMHPAVFCFPSSVDVDHFVKARERQPDREDQRGIGHPRIGFFGVIDERMDLDLVAQAAATLPDVQFVMLGPTAKIDPEHLPQAPNIHWLGRKEYSDLPAYMSGWSAAWMPFALNEATRFISPTKTPEFLAAGLPVTSTAVKDVVDTYGRQGIVTIADRDDVAIALRTSLQTPDREWLSKVDGMLASMSWNLTWSQMRRHIQSRLSQPVGVTHV